MIVLKLNEILDRPGGTKLNAIVEVHLDRILKAVLIFKGMMIEWVVVKGWEEELVKQDTGQPDIWGESRYHVGEPFFLVAITNLFQVFQRITENANAAMLHFQSPIYPELAVKSFMTYLHRLNIFKLNEPANRLPSANSFPTLAALGACSVTSVAAVEVIFRTTCLQLGESLGPWRLFTRTAGLETPSIRSSIPV